MFITKADPNLYIGIFKPDDNVGDGQKDKQIGFIYSCRDPYAANS